MIKYNTKNIVNTFVECDKSIIKCNTYQDGKKLKIKIFPVKPGKTKIVIKERKENNTKTVYKRKVYVHLTKIITLGNYLGKCNADFSIIIAFVLTLFIILFYSIKQFIKGIKKNIYEYRNIKLLGFSLFIANTLIWVIYEYSTEITNNYHSSIGMLIEKMNNMTMIFDIFILPIAFITSILVAISNIKLVIKEGKSWKNMLGLFLGGTICLLSIGLIIMNTIVKYDGNFVFNFILSFLSSTFSLSLSYLECILFGTIIIGFVSANKKPSFDKDFIIILGCKIKKDGLLLPLVKGRVDKAIEFAKNQKQKTGKDVIFVPSGGKGKDELISEAEAMKRYLLEQKIDEKNIIIENKSRNTYENIKFSYKVIKKNNSNPKIAFSTTNYHVFRVGNIASSQNLNIEGIGSRTKAYYWINAFIREFVATLVSEKRNHIKILFVLWIIVLILTIMEYLYMYA